MQQEQRINNATDLPAERTVLFGTFSVNLQTGELRKGGVKIRLQNKPFQILKALIDQPGRVVTREDLRTRLWPEDTFVDFESGLNTAANRLRFALGDSADNPRYIETLPRIGYRFIAPARQVFESSLTIQAPEKPILLTPAPVTAVTPFPGRLRVAALPRNPASIGLLAAVLFGLGIGSTFLWLRVFNRPVTPSFRQLTFRKGAVDNARFTASGEVVYSAAWNGGKRSVYLMDTASPESRELGFGPTWLASVSKSSDLALIRKPSEGEPGEFLVSELHGAAPRILDKHISQADWASDGTTLCIVREGLGGWSLEYPLGKTLYRAAGWAGRLRISPKSDLVALVEHPLSHDDAGSILVIDKQGHVQRLSEGWDSVAGLAWSPKGDEVWFAAAKQGINRDLYAVDLKKHLRRVASMTAMLDLFDISASRRVLVGRSVSHMAMFVGDLASSTVKDTSWLDWSHVVALSADGNSILFDESGEGGGPLYTVYLYHRDRGTTERIGHGRALDISSDGQWILTGNHRDSSQIKLISASNSQEKTFCAPGLMYQSAHFIPHSRDIVIQANGKDKPLHTYLQNLDSGELRSLPNADLMQHITASPDGKEIAGFISATQIGVVNLATDQETTIATAEVSVPVGWPSNDELLIELQKGSEVVLEKLNVHSLRISPFRSIPEENGKLSPEPFEVLVSQDMKIFAYSRTDISTGLFAVDGWS